MSPPVAPSQLRPLPAPPATAPPGSSGFITFGLSGGGKWAPGPTVLTITLRGPHVLQSLLGHRVRVSLPQSEGLRSHQATSLLLPGPLTASGTPEPTPVPPAAPWVGDTCSPLLRPPDARPLTTPVLPTASGLLVLASRVVVYLSAGGPASRARVPRRCGRWFYTWSP